MLMAEESGVLPTAHDAASLIGATGTAGECVQQLDLLGALLGEASVIQPACDESAIRSRCDDSRLLEARLGLASGLVTALRSRSATTAAHSLRVGLACSSWGVMLELSDEQLDALEIAALLHDVGKIGVPDSVLHKPSSFTAEEAAIMQRRGQIGFEILSTFCSMPAVLEILKYSGSWYDGSAAPNDHVGDELPLGSRMLAIVDAFDSMTHPQVYRAAISSERAIEELYAHAGTQFDLGLVDAFANMQRLDQQHLNGAAARGWLRELEPEFAQANWQLNHNAWRQTLVAPEVLFEQKLLENMHDAVVFVDSECNVLLWNRGAERMTGIAGSSIYQQQFQPDLLKLRNLNGRMFTSNECPVRFAIATGNQSRQRMRLRGRNDQDSVVEIHVIPVADSQGTTLGATLILRDLSSETSLEERCQDLYEKAIKDPLTQLANRAEFDRAHEEFVAEHKRRGLPFSLLICDIDHFKRINDTYGHQAGDEAIRYFANLLKSSCRAGDLVGRYGGEEFVMLCADCDSASVAQRAEQIRRQLSALPQPALSGKPITASFGTTEIQVGDTAETMLRRADRALMMAKENGRNRVVQLGSGVREASSPPPKRRWWPLRTTRPSVLVEHDIFSYAPLNMTIAKLRGFISDHHAEIVVAEGNHIELAITSKPAAVARRQNDRPLGLVLELDFEDAQQPAKNADRSVQRTKLHVRIRQLRLRERRHSDAAAQAAQLAASLRCYLMASQEEPEVDSGRAHTKATHLITPWWAKQK